MKSYSNPVEQLVSEVSQDIWAPFVHNVMQGDRQMSFRGSRTDAMRAIELFLHSRGEVFDRPGAPLHHRMVTTEQMADVLCHSTLSAAMQDYANANGVAFQEVQQTVQNKARLERAAVSAAARDETAGVLANLAGRTR